MTDEIDTKLQRENILKKIDDLTYFGPVGELKRRLQEKLASDADESLANIETLYQSGSRLREIVHSSFEKIDKLEEQKADGSRNVGKRSLDKRSLDK